MFLWTIKVILRPDYLNGARFARVQPEPGLFFSIPVQQAKLTRGNLPKIAVEIISTKGSPITSVVDWYIFSSKYQKNWRQGSKIIELLFSLNFHPSFNHCSLSKLAPFSQVNHHDT